MSLRNTYTEHELQLLKDHHLDTGTHCQLSDAFIIGYRKAKDEGWINSYERTPKRGVLVALKGGDIERLGLKTTAGYYSEIYGSFFAIFEEDELELCWADYWKLLP